MSVGNNKISRKNVERLISSTVYVYENGSYIEVDNTTSANDIQLYIELSKRQDCLGRVDGVYYADFMELLDCSKATFYNSLYRLEKLQYISIESDRKGYWSITLLDNVFLTEKDYKNGYMRTNVDFLYSDDFKKMSYVEKRMCLYLHLNKDRFSKFEIYPAKLAKAIGIKILSVVKEAAKGIASIFSNMIIQGSQGDKIVFGVAITNKNEETEDSNYIRHKLKHMCRAYAVKHTEKSIDDVGVLSGQYIRRIGYNKFISIVNRVIFHDSVNREILPSHINKLCKQLIKI